MPIRMVNGEYKFDTAKEAADFYRMSGAGRDASKNGGGSPGSEVSVLTFKTFLGRLQKNQKKIVRAMLASGGAVITDTELRQAVKADDNRALGGIMAGISKQAKNSGFEVEALWGSEKKHSETGVPSKQYTLTELFRKVAAEAGELK